MHIRSKIFLYLGFNTHVVKSVKYKYYQVLKIQRPGRVPLSIQKNPLK